MGHSEGELWGLAVHPSRDIYVSASYDGDIKIWNTNSKKLIKKYKTDSEIRCIDFSPDGLALATGSKDGDVYLFKISRDCDSLEKVSSNRQRNATITDIKFDYSTYIYSKYLSLVGIIIKFDFRFSPRKSFLATGSSDNAIDVYQINTDGQLVRIAYCLQVPGPVLQMDWSTSAEYLKVKI